MDDKLDTSRTNTKQQTTKLPQPKQSHSKTIHKSSRHAQGMQLCLKYPQMPA